MNRITTVTMALVLVAALAAMPLGAASALTGVQDGDEEVEDVDEVDEVQPGERLSGVVGVQQAEVDGEVTERAYGVKIAQAQTDEARADVVNETLKDVEDRIDELEDRLEELEDAREDGEITDGQYRAEVAKVVAEKRTVERLADATEATVTEHGLEERGIDVEAIGELRERAAELSGPAVAEIAQSIAGEEVGQSIAADREPGSPIEAPGQDRDDVDSEEIPDDGDREEVPDGGEDEETDESTPENGTGDRSGGE